jgi:hypothetical protein
MHPVLRCTEDDRVGVGFAGQLGKLPGGIAAALHQLHGHPLGSMVSASSVRIQSSVSRVVRCRLRREGACQVRARSLSAGAP